jgi:hypothetical protein
MTYACTRRTCIHACQGQLSWLGLLEPLVTNTDRQLLTHFERRVAFQKFLIEFSVRPGRRLVIFDQWLPTTAWHWASRNSSSKDQLPLRLGMGRGGGGESWGGGDAAGHRTSSRVGRAGQCR